jgi:glycosyltransferase involved in cell wall biosynthesis
VEGMCDLVKKELRIYPNTKDYGKEIIITEDLTEEQIKALHLSCDCFVCPTHGEGWSIPSFEAMCYGKTPICSNEGGPKEYIDLNNKNTGYLIDGVYDVCNHSDPAFGHIFTGREEWFHPSESEIKKAMRFYYDNRITSIDGIKQGEKFSFEKVGKIIKDTIQS